MRRLFLLVLVISAAAGLYVLMRGGEGGGEGGHGMMGGGMPVGVAVVDEREVQVWDEFSGRLGAVERVEVRPRVAGTIDAIHFTEGQMVKKGDLLITIDPKPYEAALQSARARMTFAESEFARAKTLLPGKAISQREYDDKKNAYEVARADYTKASLDMGYTQVKAPVDGRIGRPEITVGNLVGEGGMAQILTTIVSLDPIYVDFDVDEQSYVKYLSANGNDPQKLVQVPVELGLAGQADFPYRGHIQSFDNELNTRAGTVRARALFDNKNGALIPGLFAHVRIAGAGNVKSVLVNERSIGTDQNKKFVYVMNAENKVEYRNVTLGAAVDGMRIILEGLKPGEKVVVEGVQRAQPGAPVTPQMLSMDTLQPLKEDSGVGILDSGEAKPLEEKPQEEKGEEKRPTSLNPGS